MTGWDDIPTELADDVWNQVEAIMDLSTVDDVAFWESLEALKNEDGDELEKRLSALAEIQKRADEAKFRMVGTVSKRWALQFRGELHARLAALEEFIDKLMKAEDREYWKWRNRTNGFFSRRRESYEVDNTDRCLRKWREVTTRRLELFERFLARVDNWQTCSECWRQLPAELVDQVLGHALRLCVPNEKVWNVIERDRWNDCSEEDEADRHFRELKKTVFSLSVVCKGASSQIASALEYLIEEFQDQENDYKILAYNRSGVQYDAESDPEYELGRATCRAEDWHEGCKSLRKLAYRLQCVVLSWANRGSKRLPEVKKTAAARSVSTLSQQVLRTDDCDADDECEDGDSEVARTRGKLELRRQLRESVIG